MFTLAINQVELSMHITLFDSSLYIKALDKKYFLPKFDAVNTSKVAQKRLHSQLEPTAPSNGQRSSSFMTTPPAKTLSMTSSTSCEMR